MKYVTETNRPATILGYSPLEYLSVGNFSEVLRARRFSDQRSVILKIIKNPYPSAAELNRFVNEVEMTRAIQGTGVAKILAFEKVDLGLMMVLEDIGGDSLNHQGERLKGEILKTMLIVRQVAHTLAQIHQQRIIHQNLNPANIIWNPASDDVELIDFGAAAPVFDGSHPLASPPVFEGTLAYMAPEQSGRINKGVDCRSDLYALGVTFYELLTGEKPIKGGDALEWVHAHIATPPVPPQKINAAIPEIIGKIVLKLMAKEPDDRYQNAHGLFEDLSFCIEHYQKDKLIPSFQLGRNDISARFAISGKLYGRLAEKKALMEAVTRVQRESPQLLLVSGYAGSGKTALIHEHKAGLIQKGGLFLSGKCEQLQRNVPYLPFIKALKSWIRQVITEKPGNISSLKKKLLSVLDGKGRVISSVVPELERLIGPQPELPELSAEGTKNRFNFFFKKFITALVEENSLLILFFDDIHCCDLSSLELLTYLLRGPFNGRLLIIGTCRDNDVASTHSLDNTLKRLAQEEGRITHMQLNPLKSGDISQLVSDTFACTLQEVEDLSELIFLKSGGNPFYVKQFLNDLYDKKMIVFSEEEKRWRWDTHRIMRADMPGSVPQMMISRINQLSHQSRALLKTAACLGSSFSFQTLLAITDNSKKMTARSLWAALKKGLILPADPNYRYIRPENFNTGEAMFDGFVQDSYFVFLHDRVQEAAYAQLRPQEKAALHLKIGELLLEQSEDPQRDADLLEMVHHLNLGATLVTEEKKRLQLARLNLWAGRKARDSAAYGEAYAHYQKGLTFLADDAWQTGYRLSLDLHVEKAETEYMTGRFTALEETAHLVLARAQTTLDKIKVYQAQIRAAIAGNQLKRAIQTAMTALGQLGVRFPRKALKVHVGLQLLKVKKALAGRKTSALSALAEMTDPEKRAAMEIMAVMSRPVYFVSPELAALLGFKVILMTLKEGLCPASAAGFMFYSILLCSVLGDMKNAYAFGLLATRIIERFNAIQSRPAVTFLFNLFIRHWREPLQNSLSPLLGAYKSGLDCGAHTDAANAAQSFCSYLFLSGSALDKVDQEMMRFDRRIGALNQTTILYQLRILHQLVIHLRGKAADPRNDFSGAIYQESKYAPRHLAAGDNTSLFLLHYAKMEFYFQLGMLEKAIECASDARKYVKGGAGLAAIPRFYALDSLIRLRWSENETFRQRLRTFYIVRGNQTRLKHWLRFFPDNIFAHYWLVEAEQARIRKNYTKASRCYKKAIDHASKSKDFHTSAGPTELYGRFWLHQDEPEMGLQYLKKAVKFYEIWGAGLKVKALTDEFPELKNMLPNNGESQYEGPLFPETLDLKSVLKASQAMSKEVATGRLLERLMHIVTENAGARKGYLMLRSTPADSGNYIVEAFCEAGVVSQNVFVPVAVADCKELSLRIVFKVAQTGELVVLDDATDSGPFKGDPLLVQKRIRSLLCLPIWFQGQMTGILYLEHDQASGVFTPERIEVLQLIAAQAAISINNARLYTKYRSLFVNAVEGIFQTTVDGLFIDVNPAMAEILGYASKQDFISQHPDIKTLFVDLDDQQTLLRILREKNRAFAFDTRLLKKNGTSIWISISVRAIINVHQETTLFEGSIVDISERVEKERAERKREAAEAANRIKSQFLAVMSHEIRTPINAIIGLSSMTLKEEKLPPEAMRNLSHILSSTRSLLAIVNDILDMTKIEAGRLKLEYIGFNLTGVIEQMVGIFSPQARAKNIELTSVIDDNVPLNLIGDPTRLGQILINLVSNAIKFTPQGTVTLTVRCAAEQQKNKVRLDFTVADTGVGIEPEQVQKLFKPFIQGDTSTSRRYGGTGLGLAISSQLVSMMQGSIGVESEPGKGAVFYFQAEFGIETYVMKGPSSNSLNVWEKPEKKPDLLDLVGQGRKTLFLKKLTTLSSHLRKYDPVGVEAAMAELDELLRPFEGREQLEDLQLKIDSLDFEQADSMVAVLMKMLAEEK